MSNIKKASHKVREVCKILLTKAQNMDLVLSTMQDPENDILEVLGTISQALALKREKFKPLDEVKSELATSPYNNLPTLDSVFSKNTPHIQAISEIKFASPSAGPIAPAHLNAIDVATGYVDAGAKAISILCEEVGFGGSLSFLNNVRQALPEACILQKDFLLNKYQVYEGRLAGASAFLIIIALVTTDQLVELLETARELHIIPLIEIHNNDELAIILQYYQEYQDVIKVVGVNNRDLITFKVDLNISKNIHTDKLNELSIITISESGIASTQDAKDLQTHGYDGFLVGTAFMKTNDPTGELKRFIKGNM